MIDRFEDFTSYINQAHKYILKIKAHEMKPFGLKAAHVMCLFHIGKHGEGLTAGELATLAMEDKAAISKALSELKQKELILVDDGGGTRIYRAKYLLTERGREIFTVIERIIVKTVEECGRGLTAEERVIFYRSLKTIVSNLKDYSAILESDVAAKINENNIEVNK